MDKIKWCLDTKNGIEIIEPNDNLSKAYIKKAEDALSASTVLENTKDWEISSLYYTMYFSLYAILMKIGIKCGIHSCTIEFMKQFLNDYFTDEEISLIKKSMKARIDTQYYTDRKIQDSLYSQMIKEAPVFLTRCKEILVKIKNQEILRIRDELSSIKNLK